MYMNSLFVQVGHCLFVGENTDQVYVCYVDRLMMMYYPQQCCLNLLGRVIEKCQRLLDKHWIVIAYAVSCCRVS